MASRRGIATDQLMNVIQVLQLGRKTGQLSIERGEEPQREWGEITFLQGRIISAQCGQLEGQAAMDWLKTWGPCRFIFVNDIDRATGPMVNLQSSSSTSTNPSLPAIRPSVSSPLPNDTRRRPSTGPMPALPVTPTPIPSIQASHSGPQRACTPEEGLRRLAQANLSRHHRQLYLLIDGSRSVMELIRLTGRQPGEVQQLLYDLERIGIIR
ncbi:DUF4388 domain-containing protein [Dictyobacter aurantiacus]|uniref:PatA-like N-terminal domain-containing protein n=1 Tax=Dictyobacter aurantiacus TaxID=1936993 RepID=A0A401ZIJ8_9CHLR|nr:DUF4388 domain-containing protein [Dictyobacter aurantiacus]GCE06676.1 hypothetical protein KDAU_40050 [Dictyobacter aurantiacus]